MKEIHYISASCHWHFKSYSSDP